MFYRSSGIEDSKKSCRDLKKYENIENELNSYRTKSLMYRRIANFILFCFGLISICYTLYYNRNSAEGEIIATVVIIFIVTIITMMIFEAKEIDKHNKMINKTVYKK